MIERWRVGWMVLGLPVFFGMACLGGDSFSISNPLPGADSIVLTFRSVTVGGLHSCAVTTANAAYCWGANGLGQLGVGDQDNRFQPWPVAGGRVFKELSGGGTFTCGLATGSGTGALAFCWGSNDQGQLGIGDLTFINVAPTSIDDPLFNAVSAGGAHGCGISTDRSAWCWGSQSEGRLGNGESGPTPRLVPVQVLGDLSFTDISAGANHTCAITEDTAAYCWGVGDESQLGNGDRSSSDMPVAVSGNLELRQISAGESHTCAITLDGDAYCWGLGTVGQLGVSGVGRSDVPIMISGGFTFLSISAGGNYTCGTTVTMEAYCWGGNDSGQLGDGTVVNRAEPVLVLGNIEFESVSAGKAVLTSASCGISIDNIVYCWGFGGTGQLGDGTGDLSAVPVRVAFQR